MDLGTLLPAGQQSVEVVIGEAGEQRLTSWKRTPMAVAKGGPISPAEVDLQDQTSLLRICLVVWIERVVF